MSNTHVCVGILLFETRSDRGELSLRLFLRDALLETRDRCQEVRAALACDWLAACGIARDRGPELDRIILDRKLKVTRHHANHGKLDAVQRDGLIEDRWIAAEPILKERMTEHHDSPCFGRLVFVRKKSAAQHRLDTQERKEIRSHDVALQARGLATAGHDEVAAVIRRHVLEHGVLRAHVHEVWI